MSSTTSARGLADRVAERTGSGVPKFKTLPPPSLPISTPSAAASSSSWFAIPPGLSPAELLDSPILLSSSNLLPSPTTGTFPLQGYDWKRDFDRGYNQRDTNKEANVFSDFSFQTQAKTVPSYDLGQQPWGSHDSLSNSTKPEIDSRPEITPVTQTNNDQQSDHNRRSDDGYNWRKYGQKQVKGSENPRSYYKCTYPNCPTKKKVERSLEGQITEIVYKGTHNHPKPQSTRRSSSSSSASSVVVNQSHAPQFNEIQEQSSSYVSNGGAGKADSSLVVTPDNSSISVGDDDLEQSSQKSRSRGGDEIDDEEHDTKRWKGEGESEGISAARGLGNRAVREPRVVVQTTSDIDILDDGYRWRKYGQKVVKGNPNPRSYYKCTSQGCQVRKHVERASQDLRAVITTYEGKHNHDVPAARGSGSHSVPVNRPMPLPVPIPNNETNPGRIRPSAGFSHSSYPVQMRNRNSVLEAEVGYNPHHMGGFQEFPGIGSNSMPSSNPFFIANNNDNNNDSNQPSSNGRDSASSLSSSFTRAKDEPRDFNDMFLESLLY